MQRKKGNIDYLTVQRGEVVICNSPKCQKPRLKHRDKYLKSEDEVTCSRCFEIMLCEIARRLSQPHV